MPHWWDRAGNGVIRWAELHSALHDLDYWSVCGDSSSPYHHVDGDKTPTRAVDQLLHEADVARDGLISFEEFVTLYHRLSELPDAVEGDTAQSISRWPGLFQVRLGRTVARSPPAAVAPAAVAAA